MKALFFSPAALGDMILSSGVARSLLTEYEEIIIPANKSFIPTMNSMFMDEPRIKCFEYDDIMSLSVYAKENNLKRIESPYQRFYVTNMNGRECAILWDEQVYTIFNIPFSQRYKTFVVPNLQTAHEIKKQIVKNPRYILVHRNHSGVDGILPIDLHYWREKAKLDPLENFQIIDIDPSLTQYNMMNSIELIRGAEEIHCVGSSFQVLVDSVNQITGAKLFYHDIRATTWMRVNNQWNNYRWCIISYKEKT